MATTSFFEEWQNTKVRDEKYSPQQQSFIRKAMIIVIDEGISSSFSKLMEWQKDQPSFYPDITDEQDRNAQAAGTIVTKREQYKTGMLQDDQFEQLVVSMIKQEFPDLKTEVDLFKVILKELKAKVDLYSEDAIEERNDFLAEVLDEDELDYKDEFNEQERNSSLDEYKDFFEQATKLFPIKPEELLQEQKRAPSEISRFRH